LRRVAFGRHGDRLDITLDRPAKRNAVDALLRDQLIEALTPANLDEGIVRVELRGNGPSFCAGGDLAEFGTVADPAVGHLIRTARSLPLAVLGCAPRLTTHVHGHTVGAGVELAAFGARVVATPTTVFTLPEVAMGLIPGAGGTVSLPRRIGRARATAFALTGRPLDAVTAQRWGLVDEFTALEPADGEGVG
jgi:enoyl-CoA hydratase/carnithine racemase